jgi:poly(A) polymerase
VGAAPIEESVAARYREQSIVTENHRPTTPRVLARPHHNLSRSVISANAVKVLYRLHNAGYQAYLVGGGVRDLLLGRSPKDFDVGTNARPEEVRRLFRNSRIIGRRFRLVHILFRDEVVEVSTFRASPDAPEPPEDWEEQERSEREDDAADGRGLAPVSDERVYGTPGEDARRRDLTINALFYDIADFSVIDWVGGIEDLEAGVVRTVGVPTVRFEEDPVRMMRALEYAVRLGFELEHETEEGIAASREHLREASPARLTYEFLEAARSGAAKDIWAAWKRYGIVDVAYPEIGGCEGHDQVLGTVDSLIQDGFRLPDASILGGLFVPRAAALLENLTSNGERLHNPTYIDELKNLLAPTSMRMVFSNHTNHLVFHGLFTLSKFRRPPERGRQVVKMVRHPDFPVAWDLARLAARMDCLPGDVIGKWEQAVEQVRQTPKGQEPRLGLEDGARPRRRRRRRPRRRRRSE